MFFCSLFIIFITDILKHWRLTTYPTYYFMYMTYFIKTVNINLYYCFPFLLLIETFHSLSCCLRLKYTKTWWWWWTLNNSFGFIFQQLLYPFLYHNQHILPLCYGKISFSRTQSVFDWYRVFQLKRLFMKYKRVFKRCGKASGRRDWWMVPYF